MEALLDVKVLQFDLEGGTRHFVTAIIMTLTLLSNLLFCQKYIPYCTVFSLMKCQMLPSRGSS